MVERVLVSELLFVGGNSWYYLCGNLLEIGSLQTLSQFPSVELGVWVAREGPSQLGRPHGRRMDYLHG